MKKQKKFTKYIILTGLLSLFGLTACNGNLQSNQVKREHLTHIKRDNPTPQEQQITYDDVNYTVEIKKDALNEYRFPNFAREVYRYYITLEQTGNLGKFSYDNAHEVDFGRGSEYTLSFTYQGGIGVFAFGENQNNYEENLFTKLSGDWTQSLYLQLPNYYSRFKSAFQNDVIVNNTEMEDTIIPAITSGLGLVNPLAQEFLGGFSNLFWDQTNSTLTSFGTFALVFLGIAITMAVIKLVLNILRGSTGV